MGVQIHIIKSCNKFDLTCLEGLINEEAEKRAQSPRVTGGYFLFYKCRDHERSYSLSGRDKK